jgi:maleate isomerase
MPGYEAKVAELAEMRPDLIRPSGAPPFMLLGFEGERQIIRSWESKYRVQMFTSGQNHVRALRALGINRFIGASYFPDKMNAIFARYFTEAGFQVLGMEGIDVAFAEVPRVPAAEIFHHLKRMAEKYRGSQGIYMLGSAWKTLDIVDKLEQSLGLPVIHPSPARCWETQLRLGLRHPIAGYGRLLAEMPG